MLLRILQKISLVPSYLWDAMWAPVWKYGVGFCLLRHVNHRRQNFVKYVH